MGRCLPDIRLTAGQRLILPPMIQPGCIVRFVTMPTWVADLPEDSRRVFAACLGRTYRVTEIDVNGLYVLDVSGDVDSRVGGFGNDIRLEAEFLELVEQG